MIYHILFLSPNTQFLVSACEFHVLSQHGNKSRPLPDCLQDSLQSSPNYVGVLLHIQSLFTEKELSNLKGNYKT